MSYSPTNILKVGDSTTVSVVTSTVYTAADSWNCKFRIPNSPETNGLPRSWCDFKSKSLWNMFSDWICVFSYCRESIYLYEGLFRYVQYRNSVKWYTMVGGSPLAFLDHPVTSLYIGVKLRHECFLHPTAGNILKYSLGASKWCMIRFWWDTQRYNDGAQLQYSVCEWLCFDFSVHAFVLLGAGSSSTVEV